MPHDSAGNFADWVRERGLSATLLRTHAGEAMPGDPGAFSGLCVLGGEMSANDDHLPWLRDELALLRAAIDARIPIIGHCLGGQMLSRVLGGTVGVAPQPELGWQPIRIAEDEVAAGWFGDAGVHHVVQWHFEAFTVPVGASPLAASDACACQAFAYDGIHLGMQFHVEVDRPKVTAWAAADAGAMARLSHLSTVQTAARFVADSERHLAPMRRLAYRIYDRWALALREDQAPTQVRRQSSTVQP